MAQDSYPFIDIAVIDPLRARFLAGDAIVVLDVKLERIIWANGAGARLFGHNDIEAARDAVADLGITTRRQIAATPGFPKIGPGRSLLVRMTQGLSSHAIGIVASAITLPDGKAAIMLAAPDIEAAKRPATELAQRAIYGIGEAGHHAALVDGDGEIIAQSAQFQELGLERETLRQLAKDVAIEADRLAKRLVRAKGHSWPAGIALLSDDPVRALLVVVDDPLDEEAASPPLFGRRESPETGRNKADLADDNWEFVDRRSRQVAPALTDAAQVLPVVLEQEPEPQAVESPEQSKDIEALPEAPAASSPARLPTMVAPNTTLLPGGDIVQEPANDSAPAVRNVAADKGHAGERDGELGEDVEADAARPDEDEAAPFAPDLRSGPVRFVWKTDANGHFSDLSHEFAKAVGEKVANVIGQPFREVAARFGLDPDGEIAGLLERRDTWSGRSVMWPIQDTDLKAPVDLAALPVYGRDRQFEGFRGFGVVRLADAVVDEDAAGKEFDRPSADPAGQAATDSIDVEPPVLAPVAKDARVGSDKVIRLAEHRTSTAERALSATESNAFREIGERLREANTDLPSTPDAKPRQPADDFEAQGEYVNVTPETIDAPWDDETDSFDEVDGSEGDDADALFADDIDFAPNKAAPDADLIERADGDECLDDDDQTDRRAAAANDTSILAKLPIPLIIHSGDELHFANEEFFALTGYESLDDFADAGGLDALFAEPDGDETVEPGDHRRLLITRDGSRFRVEALLQSVPWGHGKALMLAMKPAPDAIAPAEASNSDTLTEEIDARVAELQTILDTATDGIVIITNEGDIRSLSRPAEALFGFDSFELVGKPFVSLFAVESQRSARDYLSGLSDNGVASVLNDGREVIGRESRGRYIPLFMTIGRLPAQNGYCAVLRDITHWKRAEEELTQARAEAERSSGQKTEFLARISHEIRTPLNAIIGFSELMIDEKFGPVLNDRYRDYLRDINRSGNHVLDLVNDLLDISKIEAGEQEMAHEAVSLNETLAEAVAMMQPQANRERVIIRSSFASRLPEVVADQRSIRQIALNLLSNAVRYTQAGGQVIVSTSYETSGDVVMRFRDTGVGMSQAEIEQAMKPFKQINALKRQRGDGTGLGLPLTKAMVEANRARFVINSAPSEGTLIEITFPSTRVLAG